MLRSDLRSEVAGLRAEMHEHLGRMTRTIVLSVVAANAALASAILAARQI